MPKTAYILAVMLYSILSYGQEITFHKNVNYRASTLLQHLNKDRDSLILESKVEKILKIDIFNNDFSKSIDVYSNKTTIDLNNLPAGDYVIQANINKHWIIMYLEKNEDSKTISSNQMEKNELLKTNFIIQTNKDAKIATLDRKEKILNKSDIKSNFKTSKVIKKDNSSYYWVVSESNSNFGSNKSMRLEYKEDVDRLIAKTKIELKSDVGKNNKLLVYEIYNRSQFMTKQLRNPVYYKSEDSEFFNVVPIYASRN